jgi:hypothetical protein
MNRMLQGAFYSSLLEHCYGVEKTKNPKFETSGFAPNKMAVMIRYEVGNG